MTYAGRQGFSDWEGNRSAIERKTAVCCLSCCRLVWCEVQSLLRGVVVGWEMSELGPVA